MRVLLLSSYTRWHGGEVVFSALAEGLAHRSHEVTLLCRRGSALESRHSARAGGGSIRVLTGRLRGEGDPRSHLEVARALRLSGAQVLLTNLGRDLKFAAPAARLMGVPHVHRFAQLVGLRTAEGLPADPALLTADGLARLREGGGGELRPVKRKRIQGLLLERWVSACITPSEFMRELLLVQTPRVDAVSVIANGVDTEVFRPDPEAGRRWRAARGIEEGKLLVGCVGQLERRRKAQQTLIRAAPGVRTAARFVFIGKGPDRAAFETLARALGVDAFFAGFEPDMASAYNALDVVALPSRLEAFGLALVEAMACGRPVVACATGSVPELIRSGEEGCLVPPDDPKALAEALDTVVADALLRSRLGAAGRARVQRDFPLQRMLDGYETLLESVRRRRSRRERAWLALGRRPKRLLYPFLGLRRGPVVAPRDVDLSGTRRVLLLRELTTLGDALLATPAVRELKRVFPELRLAMVAGHRNAGVWRYNPRLERVFVLERGNKAVEFARLVRAIRAWRPDVAVTLESLGSHGTLDMIARLSGAPVRVRYDGGGLGSPHTTGAYNCLVPVSSSASKHQIDICAGVLRPLGVELLDRSLELFVGEAAEAAVGQLLADRGIGSDTAFAVVHPGSKQIHNRWPFENFLAVRDHLRARWALRVLFSFGPHEEPARGWLGARGVDAEDLLPRLSLEELAALLRRARLLVCPDTGVLHVGAAVGVPVVGLYGSGDPEIWQPPGAVRAVGDHRRGKVRGIRLADVLEQIDLTLEAVGGEERRDR